MSISIVSLASCCDNTSHPTTFPSRDAATIFMENNISLGTRKTGFSVASMSANFFAPKDEIEVSCGSAQSGGGAYYVYPCVPRSVFFIVGVLGALVCALGLLCNLLSILVFVRRSRRSSATSVLFLALAAFDMIFLLFYFIYGPAQVLATECGKKSPLSSTFSYSADGLSNTAATGSVFLTAALTADRSLAVSRPLYWQTISTRQRTAFLVLGITVCALLLNTPLLLRSLWNSNGVKERNGSDVLSDNLVFSHFHGTVYLRAILPVFQLVVPSTIIIVCTSVIGLQLRKNAMTVAIQGPVRSNQSQTTKRSKASNRITAQIVVVATTTLLTNGLLAFSFVVTASYEATSFQDCPVWCSVYVSLAYLMVAANASINLLVYCLLNKHFRQDVLFVLRCKTETEGLPSISPPKS